jgi:vitamin B12 transporter
MQAPKRFFNKLTLLAESLHQRRRYRLYCFLVGGLIGNVSFADVAISDIATPLVISATRFPTDQTLLANDVSVIDTEDLQRAPGQTLDEILTRTAGIETARTGQSGATSSFFLRGGNSNHTLILVDGQRINDISSGITAIQHIPSSMIDHIEIVRGSTSSLYGSDAVGGVIQIFTKQGAGQPHLEGGFEAGSYGYTAQNIAYRGEVNNMAFNIAVNHRQAHGHNATLPDNKPHYHPDRDGYRNKSLHTRVDYHLREAHIIGASLYATDAKIDIDNATPLSSYQHSHNRQKLVNTSFYSKNQLMPWWHSEIRAGQSRSIVYQIDNTNVSLAGRSLQTQGQWMHALTYDTHQFLAGVEWRKETFRSAMYHPKDRATLSLLIGYQGNFAKHGLQTHIRHDKNSQYHRHKSSNIGYRFDVTKTLRLFANLSRAFHAPTFMDLYYPGYNNPHLKPETAINKEVGARYQLTPHWKMDLSAWHTRLFNLIQYNHSALQPENINKAKLTGTTLSTHAKWSNFTVQASFTLQQPVEQSGKVLARRAKRHGTLTLQQDLGRWLWFSDMQSSGKRHDSDGTRLGGYTLFNVGLEYRFNKAWGITTRIDNVLNKNYTTLKGYKTPGMHGVVNITYNGL